MGLQTSWVRVVLELGLGNLVGSAVVCNVFFS